MKPQTKNNTTTYTALSLKQPWATMIVQGKKTIETRTWKTSYRGDIMICSSQKPAIEPAGYALCIVELYHIEPMQQLHEQTACCAAYPKAQAWFLRNLRIITEPFRVKGQLSLFQLEVSQPFNITAKPIPDNKQLMSHL